MTQREEVKRVNGEMREIKSEMGDPWTSNPLIVILIVSDSPILFT